jgi:hypothetical protein
VCELNTKDVVLRVDMFCIDGMYVGW